MKFASFESSTEWCSVALWLDGEIAALEARAGQRHSELMLPMLQRLVAAAGIALPAQCVAPALVTKPPGEGWVGCGNGFAAYGDIFRDRFSSMKPEIHPSAVAVARLAAPRLAAGEGVDAALAVPRYVRDKVAFTRQELERQ